MVDGSFSRGSDIVKAICMGADWVGMGRLYCYGLAADGAAGIERVVELLEEEMKEVMGLLGVTSLKQLDKSYISAGHADQPARRAQRVPAAEPGRPGVLSVFAGSAPLQLAILSFRACGLSRCEQACRAVSA